MNIGTKMGANMAYFALIEPTNMLKLTVTAMKATTSTPVSSSALPRAWPPARAAMRSRPEYWKHSMNCAAKKARTMIGAMAAIASTIIFAASLSFLIALIRTP